MSTPDPLPLLCPFPFLHRGLQGYRCPSPLPLVPSAPLPILATPAPSSSPRLVSSPFENLQPQILRASSPSLDPVDRECSDVAPPFTYASSTPGLQPPFPQIVFESRSSGGQCGRKVTKYLGRTELFRTGLDSVQRAVRKRLWNLESFDSIEVSELRTERALWRECSKGHYRLDPH